VIFFKEVEWKPNIPIAERSGDKFEKCDKIYEEYAEHIKKLVAHSSWLTADSSLIIPKFEDIIT